jgi:hypothetical protein
MITANEVRDLMCATTLGENGDKIGKVGQVFLDDETGRPEWATVNTGFFGGNESFVPLAEATRTSEGLSVPYDKEQVKNAPNVSPEGGHLDQSEEAQLYRHYGLEYSERSSESGYAAGTRTDDDTSVGDAAAPAGAVGHDTSGRNTDDAMTRSEEQVRTGTETVEAGRARLRKWVETEDMNVSVPSRRRRRGSRRADHQCEP